jgi:hypothetical protein
VPARVVTALLPGVAVVLLAACSAGEPTAPAPSPEAPSEATVAAPVPAPEPTACGTVPADPALREELLQMEADDQAERTGEGLPAGTRLPPPRDRSRTARLAEVVDARGWPSCADVGEDGASAAWLVAQHADFDVVFQERVVALMTERVQQGLADATELAYLEDRVAVNSGDAQRYGTQVRCVDGAPQPATPLVDEAAVDEVRRVVGLGSLEQYYAGLTLQCEQEENAGAVEGP